MYGRRLFGRAFAALILGTLALTGCNGGGGATTTPINNNGGGAVAVTPPVIAGPSSFSPTKGAFFSYKYTVQGGKAPYTFSFLQGSEVPAGISVMNDGNFGGTTNQIGDFDLFLQVKDASSPALENTLPINLHVIDNALTPVNFGIAPVIIGSAYSAQLAFANGNPPYTFSASGGATDLGAGDFQLGNTGITLHADGSLTGMFLNLPSADFIHPFTLEVRDSSGPVRTASLPYQLHVVNPPVLSAATLEPAIVGAVYAGQLPHASGAGVFGVEYSLSGNVPNGLGVDSNGKFTGIPTLPGLYTFTSNVRFTSKPSIASSATLQLAVVSPTGYVYASDTHDNAASNNSVASATSLGVLNAITPFRSTSPASLSTNNDDTDWYRFTLPYPASVNVKAWGNNALAGIDAGIYTGTTSDLLNRASGGLSSNKLDMTADYLPAGDFWVGFASSYFFPGDLNYFFQVTLNPIAIETSLVEVDLASTFYLDHALTALNAGAPAAGPSWSRTSGTLPSGISLTTAGSLVGTPLEEGLFSLTLRVDVGSNFASRDIKVRIFNSNDGNYWEVLGERRLFDSHAPDGAGSVIATYSEAMVVAPHPDYANGAIYVLGGRSLVTGASVATTYIYHTDDMVSGDAQREFRYENLNRNLHGALRYFGAAYVQHSYGGYIYVVGGGSPSDPQNPHSLDAFSNKVERMQVANDAGTALATPGQWQAVASLPAMHPDSGNGIRGWAEFALVADDRANDADDRLYLVGGRFEEETAPDTFLQQMNDRIVSYEMPDTAALNGPGGSGAWYVKADNNTYAPRRLPSASIVDGKIYIAGGRTALSEMFKGIEMVEPNPNGNTPAISTLGANNFPSLKEGVYYAVTAQENDRLWMVGGWNDSFSPLPHLLSYEANSGAGILREHRAADFGTGFGGGAILNSKLYLLTGISHGGFDNPTGLRYHIE